jgi:hypothetical protein
MTDGEIVAAINIFCEEQQRRKRVRRQKLIDNFRQAFFELRNVGIIPKYYEDSECSAVYVEDWDNFEFD